MEIPEIDQLLNADEANVSTMRQVLAQWSADLPRLLNEASVLYATCARSFGQGVEDYLHSNPDKVAKKERMALLIRELLFSRISGLYTLAVADFLRMRVTAPYAYTRLQCESLAFIKLMKQNSRVAEEFVAIETDEQGRKFFQKYQNKVKTALQQYNLLLAYDLTSGAGVHSRFIALARGFTTSVLGESSHRYPAIGISVQEFDPENPLPFLIAVLTVLEVQANIFKNVQDAAPEIADPSLKEIKIPRFLERVIRFQALLQKSFSELSREL